MIGTTLFVSNFPFTTAESELRELFERHTPVLGLRIITDRSTGRSRGFAFVEVPDQDRGDAAIAALHESDLNGRQIVVSVARGRPAGDVKAPNASATATPEPFKHRIVIDWVEDEGRYEAEVPDLGVSARAISIDAAVREVQAITRHRRTAAGASS